MVLHWWVRFSCYN